MGAVRRKFTKEFKEEAVRRLGLGASLGRRELNDFGGRAFTGNGERRADESKLAEMERKGGRQALEIDFLRRCLQHVEEQRKLQALNTGSSSTRTWKKK